MAVIESFYYSSDLFRSTFVLYCLTFLCYLLGLGRRRQNLATYAYRLFALAFLLGTALIINRWIDAGRPPFKTFYESLVFATWTISLVSLGVERRYKVRLFGLLSSLSIIVIFLYALSKRDVEIIALPPALQTWIFIPHVITYFLAYGALFVAGISAVLFLFLPRGISSHHYLGEKQFIEFSAFTYEIAKVGFLFLTGGLLLGAWWGQVAWSNYWGWDPKENWALITWLIFAAYLHFRNLQSWSERRLAWVIILGVIAIIFTYLGMDYLPTADDSLHIYSDN